MRPFGPAITSRQKSTSRISPAQLFGISSLLFSNCRPGRAVQAHNSDKITASFSWATFSPVCPCAICPNVATLTNAAICICKWDAVEAAARRQIQLPSMGRRNATWPFIWPLRVGGMAYPTKRNQIRPLSGCKCLSSWSPPSELPPPPSPSSGPNSHSPIIRFF